LALGLVRRRRELARLQRGDILPGAPFAGDHARRFTAAGRRQLQLRAVLDSAPGPPPTIFASDEAVAIILAVRVANRLGGARVLPKIFRRATSNAVGRANRRYRKMRKSIYGVRTQAHIIGRLALDFLYEKVSPTRDATLRFLHAFRATASSQPATR
jgi:hypothetical protein